MLFCNGMELPSDADKVCGLTGLVTILDDRNALAKRSADLLD